MSHGAFLLRQSLRKPRRRSNASLCGHVKEMKAKELTLYAPTTQRTMSPRNRRLMQLQLENWLLLPHQSGKQNVQGHHHAESMFVTTDSLQGGESALHMHVRKESCRF